MTRIKLEPRPAYDFVVPIAGRTTNLNHGGHLGNDRRLALLQEARVACLGMLHIEVAPFAASRAGFRLSSRATREADRTPIALAESRLACFDYRARKVVPLPDRIREICQES